MEDESFGQRLQAGGAACGVRGSGLQPWEVLRGFVNLMVILKRFLEVVYAAEGEVVWQ